MRPGVGVAGSGLVIGGSLRRRWVGVGGSSSGCHLERSSLKSTNNTVLVGAGRLDELELGEPVGAVDLADAGELLVAPAPPALSDRDAVAHRDG